MVTIASSFMCDGPAETLLEFFHPHPESVDLSASVAFTLTWAVI